MTSFPLLQWILPFSLLACVAATTGCLLYLLGRSLDAYVPSLKIAFGWWSLFFALLLVAITASGAAGLLLASLFLGACAFGAWVHVKTEATKSWTEAFLFVLSIIDANIFIGSVVFALTPLSAIKVSFTSTRICTFVFNETMFYSGALVIAPILSIIVVRMVQQLYLRPGVETELMSG